MRRLAVRMVSMGVALGVGAGTGIAYADPPPARALLSMYDTPPPDVIPPRHRSFMEDLQGIGSEWYTAMVDAPTLETSPIAPAAPAVQTESLCPQCIETGTAHLRLPLRAFGLLTYMRFSHVRAGLGVQLTFNDPSTPVALAPPVDGSGALPQPVGVLGVTGNAFVDAEMHLGPLVPYAGLDAAAGAISWSQDTLARQETIEDVPLAYVGARAGVRLYLGDHMALGAFVETSLVGAPLREVGFSLIFPEVPTS